MKAAVEKYAKKIQNNEVDPVFRCENAEGLIIDSSKEDVPLIMANFGRWVLAPGRKIEIETGGREFAIIPMEGTYRVETEGQVFEGDRKAGPFAPVSGAGEGSGKGADGELRVKDLKGPEPLISGVEPEQPKERPGKPGFSNAGAVYIPAGTRFSIDGGDGHGEAIFFSAPSSGGTKPVHVKLSEKADFSRGSLTWRRDVITLIEPGKESTNLVVGETWSPPGLWSGTPLHVHDLDDIPGGQSDHEEIYYHVMRLAESEGHCAPYTVQMLFDGKEIDKAYVMRNKYAFAIPGVSHPVVASPVSDSLYVWALAGKEGPLGMWDVPEFAYMKKIGTFIDGLEAARGKTPIPESDFESYCGKLGLSGVQKSVFLMNLRERGFDLA